MLFIVQSQVAKLYDALYCDFDTIQSRSRYSRQVINELFGSLRTNDDIANPYEIYLCLKIHSVMFQYSELTLVLFL
jgi:hypothetical protein